MTDTELLTEHTWDLLADALACHDAEAATRAWHEIASLLVGGAS